ncbi:MAG: PspC domain-containing protein [Acidobacteriaceae bacterium]|nr:PspC domain-containing protein [Acidobacteriaceae bacterium]
MNCTNCGKAIEPGARFCSGCGAAVSSAAYEYGPRPSRFVRPREGRMVAGVCAGLAMHYGIDVAIVRLIVALSILFAGVPIIAYIVAWVVMPNADYVMTPQPGNMVS